MLCPDCKTRVPDKYTYCPNCGASIPLYRIDTHSINRFVPVVCGMLAAGGIGTAAILHGIRGNEPAPQMAVSVAEKPTAQAAAPEESAAPVAVENNTPAIENMAAYAEGTLSYLPGDANLDGEVNVVDSQLVLLDYAERFAGNDGILTEEQSRAAAVSGESDHATLEDAQLILCYYTACVSDTSLREIDIRTWLRSQEVI